MRHRIPRRTVSEWWTHYVGRRTVLPLDTSGTILHTTRVTSSGDILFESILLGTRELGRDLRGEFERTRTSTIGPCCVGTRLRSATLVKLSEPLPRCIVNWSPTCLRLDHFACRWCATCYVGYALVPCPRTIPATYCYFYTGSAVERATQSGLLNENNTGNISISVLGSPRKRTEFLMAAT